MDTPDARPTPPPAPGGGADRAGAPGVDVLLRRSAQGDRASFSAFYDATVPWVHGLSTAMFRSPRDAAAATAQAYVTAWEEAPEVDLDLDGQGSPADRERQVFAWLSALSHRVSTGLLRTGGHPEHGRNLLPERAGRGDAGPATLPADLAGLVDPAAFDAVRLAWLGGRTEVQAAKELDVPVDRARTLLRDGVQQLTAAHRAAHGTGGAGSDAARPPLGSTLREDLDAGRGAELADLTALHALDTAGHTAAVGAAERRGAGELALWRARVEAGRRAVTWAFRSVVAEPPSSLLDEVLRRLPAQDVGMTLVDENRAPARPRDRRRPLKVTLLAVLAVLVLAVGAWTAWRQFTDSGIRSRVDGADDLFTTVQYPAAGGGTMQGFLSRAEDSGYLTVRGMPQLPAGRTYQVWLYPADGTAPASLGTFGANDFGEPITFRSLERYAAVSMTVEPDGGSTVPTSDVLLGMDLDPTSDVGVQYGGRPST